MLFFDQLKKNDKQLRLLAIAIAGGLGILLVGLWWVQIVSVRKYERHLQTQSYRTVRIPAVRGKILDRNGRVLAENLPCYDLDLYLGDLRHQFNIACDRALRRAFANQKTVIAAREKELGRALTKKERKRFELSAKERARIYNQARYRVASNVVAQVGQIMGQPLTLNEARFTRDYETRLALPVTVLANLNESQIARFEEGYAGGLGVELDVQSERYYPYGTLAGHVLGYLVRDDRSQPGEDAYFSYRLPDYRGVVGIEGGFDRELRGHAGAEAVLVNNLGYRVSTTMVSPPQPGKDVVLTLDINLEKTAADSIERRLGTNATAAVVVMNVHTGDVLAMVSSPAINPDYALNSAAWLNNSKLRPQINRATQQNYQPGSIFKPIVALACLKAGMNPNATVYNPGYIYIGRRRIGDLAPAGQYYNLKKAIAYSCNTYFISNGVWVGPIKIVEMGDKFHLGERTGLPTLQEVPGIFPTLAQVRSAHWYVGDTANLSIGQGDIAVTPIQMAVMASALANDGKVLWPRLVEGIESQNPDSGEKPTIFPSGVVRTQLHLPRRYFQILHNAMLMETEQGTGRRALVSGLQICGKTGTAQVMNARGKEISNSTWFLSYAPYADPRYAVVVMVEGGTWGGTSCAPIAHDIYAYMLNHGMFGPVQTAAR